MPPKNSERQWPPAAPDTPRRPAPGTTGSPLTDRMKRFQSPEPVQGPGKNEPRVIMTRRQSAKAKSKISPLESEKLPAAKQKSPKAKAEPRLTETSVRDSYTPGFSNGECEDEDPEDSVERGYQETQELEPASRSIRHTSESSDITERDLFERRFSQPMVLSQPHRGTSQHPNAINADIGTGLHATSSSHPTHTRVSSEQQHGPTGVYHQSNNELSGLFNRLLSVHDDDVQQQKLRDEAGYTIDELERHDGIDRKRDIPSEERELEYIGETSGMRDIYGYFPRNWTIYAALLLLIAIIAFGTGLYNNHFGMWDTLRYRSSFPFRFHHFCRGFEQCAQKLAEQAALIRAGRM
ncbi:hypothetical protein ABW21_db0202845 [Orbilia brochopaga]|nr:hypothetical protein ABW21_db0202845 [Drechslerella brochopaga]